MSELYHVQCVKKENNEVILKVYIVHADESEFYAKKNFALQLIWQPANPYLGVDFPIGKEISFEQFMDVEWINKHCKEFIRSVEITAIKNYPVPDGLSFKNAMERLNELPMAEFKIIVTDMKWLDQIESGQVWKSAAYDYGGS